jgi:hypothetical protein
MPSSVTGLLRAVALSALLAVGVMPAQAVEPGDTVQASLQLADRQLPLPRGEWIVAAVGVQAQPHDAAGPFGVIRTAVLVQHNGDRVTAIAEFNTNEISLSDGWAEPAACGSAVAEQRLVRYRSRSDAACIFITTSPIAGGPPAWQQALNFMTDHHLHAPDAMLTAAFAVSDRQDFVDARLHFDPADFPATDDAHRLLFAWASRFAPEFEKGMANQLAGPPLDGPLRSALLSDTPELDRRLLELEALQQSGAITPADASSQQQAAQKERPGSAESEPSPAWGWYYRMSTPVINFVTAYGVTQNAPLAVAITLTEQVARAAIGVADQGAWDQATTQATQHKVAWPVLVHIGEPDRLAGPTS